MRLLLLACAVFLAASRAPLAQAPRVVADIRPVHALAAAVMESAVAPELLLDATSDPHHVQLRPSQARALADADLLIWMGPALTPWLDDLRLTLAPDSASLALLDLPGAPLRIEGAQPTEGTEHDHAPGALDPHAWLDPVTAAFYLPAIAETLGRIDPGNAGRYAQNARAAAARLTALDAELRLRLAPLRNVPLVAYHDAYRYFLTRYDLPLAGHVTDATGAAPGAAGLRALRDSLSPGEGILCVLIETGQDTALVDTLWPNTGYRLAEIDIQGASLPAGPGLYEALLRGMADSLTACAGP